jgi:hypothetical protein
MYVGYFAQKRGIKCHTNYAMPFYTSVSLPESFAFTASSFGAKSFSEFHQITIPLPESFYENRRFSNCFFGSLKALKTKAPRHLPLFSFGYLITKDK